MQPRQDAAYAGVFRSAYFLAVAAAAVFVVLTALFGFYSPPTGDSLSIPTGNSQFQDDFGFTDQLTVQASAAEQSRDHYNRNVSIILSAVSAGLFAVAVLGLGSRFNALRAGLVLGGLLLYLTGMGFWAGGSNQWIGFIMALIVFAVLTGSIIALDDGLPLTPRTPPRRLAPSDIAPPHPLAPDIIPPVPEEPPLQQPPQTPL